METKKYIKIEQVAKITGLSPVRLRALLAEGLFPGAGKFRRLGLKKESWLIPEIDVESFLKIDRPPGRKTDK